MLEPLTVIGHKERLADLAKALSSGQLSHAYLFVGPAGVGKTTLALEFARSLLCLNRTMPACGECRSCALFASGNHPDFRRAGLEGASIKIELVRELQREASLHPVLSPRKVFLISPMDLLTEAAANGLLKTLEEPPPRVHFLGVAEDESALLPTIRSRMNPVRLGPVPVEAIVEGLLARGCAREKAEELAVRSRGLPGLALARLREETSETWNWGQALAGGDLAALLLKAGEAEKTPRLDVEGWLEEIAAYYRGLMKEGSDARAVRQALHALEAVRLARQRLAANVNPRLLLEGLFLQLCGAK